MPEKFENELARAVSRSDRNDLILDLERYYSQFVSGGEWPDDDGLTDSFERVMDAPFDDPDRALAYVALAMATSDDTEWLSYIAAGPVEDVLRDPSDEILQRVLTEARRTPRFRWLLAGVWLHAIAERCREPVKEMVGHWLNDDRRPLPPRPFV